MQFGQPLFGFSQFTPGQVDLLATLAGSGGLTVVQGTEAGVNAYSALCFVVKGTTRRMWCVAVNPADESTTPRMWSAPANTIDFGASIYQQCIVPVQLSPGEAFDFTCYFNGVNSDAVVVYGITGEQPVNMRSDGRAYPVGSLGAQLTVGTGSGTVIAAPTTPLRIFLKSANMSANGVNSSVSVTVSGNVIALMNLFGGGNATAFIPPDGLLLDPATAVTLGAGAGIQEANVVYDIIA